MKGKLLFISNFSDQRCGVAELGRQCLAELKKAGVQVDTWDGTYPIAKANGYYPANVSDYSLVYLNWHPLTLGHYVPETLPFNSPPHVAFIHDGSKGALWYDYSARISPEPLAECIHIPYPVPDYIPKTQYKHDPNRIILGYSGIRMDGVQQIESLLKAHPTWELNCSNPEKWLSLEDEINRLARSTVNIFWYGNVVGVASAVMTGIAAERPVIVSKAKMMSQLVEFKDCLYYQEDESLEELIKMVIEDIESKGIQEQTKYPCRAKQQRAWSKIIHQYIDVFNRFERI